MKKLVNLGKALTKAEQQEINGGLCDIAPPGCPCIAPPDHPCRGGGSGGPGGNTGVCITPFGNITIPCDQLCPNGTQPICA